MGPQGVLHHRHAAVPNHPSHHGWQSPACACLAAHRGAALAAWADLAEDEPEAAAEGGDKAPDAPEGGEDQDDELWAQFQSRDEAERKRVRFLHQGQRAPSSPSTGLSLATQGPDAKSEWLVLGCTEHVGVTIP